MHLTPVNTTFWTFNLLAITPDSGSLERDAKPDNFYTPPMTGYIVR